MKTLYITFRKAIPLLLFGMIALTLGSCGTYQNQYEDSDGIYATNDASEYETGEPQDKSNYYKQYFQSKESLYDEIPEDDAVFTDVEAYSTTERLDADGYVVIEDAKYEEGYGAWGSNAESVTVNVYNSGFGWYRPYWGYGYGYGYGYGHSYYGGYYPFWNVGFGWGYPYYGYGGYGFGGYYNSYYNYNNPYYGGYGNHSVAYNRGRRNSDINGRPGSTVRRNANTSGRNSYSRSETVRRNNTRATTRQSSNNIMRRSNTTRANTRTVRPTTRTTRTTPTTRRSTNTTRRSTNSVRRSSSPTRSSGTMRSSGGSRSSGTSRSSGSRRGGGRG